MIVVYYTYVDTSESSTIKEKKFPKAHLSHPSSITGQQVSDAIASIEYDGHMNISWSWLYDERPGMSVLSLFLGIGMPFGSVH